MTSLNNPDKDDALEEEPPRKLNPKYLNAWCAQEEAEVYFKPAHFFNLKELAKI